jgi:hypothetical protein
LCEVKGDVPDNVIDGDLRCAELIRHQKTRECVQSAPIGSTRPTQGDGPPPTPDEALRFAIKIAVDAGDYDRATALVEVAKRLGAKSAEGAPLVAASERAGCVQGVAR